MLNSKQQFANKGSKMTKRVLTPNGDFVSLEESGLMSIGIKTDEQIEFHNRIQAEANKTAAKEKDHQKFIEKVENTLKEIVERNNLQSEYNEIKKQYLDLKSEILLLGSFSIPAEDKDILISFVNSGLL